MTSAPVAAKKSEYRLEKKKQKKGKKKKKRKKERKIYYIGTFWEKEERKKKKKKKKKKKNSRIVDYKYIQADGREDTYLLLLLLAGGGGGCQRKNSFLQTSIKFRFHNSGLLSCASSSFVKCRARGGGQAFSPDLFDHIPYRNLPL